MADIPEYFHLHQEPVASEGAVVHVPGARFSLLTSRLIRMEISPDDHFEDRPSQVFWYRRQPVPDFEVRQDPTRLEIITPFLDLAYSLGQPFREDTLQILVKQTQTTWHFGDKDPGNLRGTTRTLDKTLGAIPLEPGLVSRSGWALVDDSRSLVFTPDGWLAPRLSPPGRLDLYFFGHGHDYQGALDDFRKVAGGVPLIPRWALGNWWSRYWEYTQEELENLMLDFRAHAVPLSVCIVDMDWHITQTGNECSGWTGYTWNRQLFPQPEKFLAFLHNQGLKAALNLHPAEGVYPHEQAYPEMAKRMGIEPASQTPVPFNLADTRFTRAYFEVLHHQNEAQGVDFWWLDWQQGTLSKLPGLDPLWWLNHLHALDLARDGRKRPFIFSRWGGLGNHRYPVGFSGDTHVSWQTLAFQPYFTATAANVAYDWWSHDIGGHMLGIEEPELYTRWVQYGVFSPILRLHSTKNPFHERRPWAYDAETFHITRRAMQLRHVLIPYLYSMAWRDHHRGIAPIRPMYYLYPEEEAYACPNQYLFGSELLAAPFVSRREAHTQLSRQVIWLPEGTWYDFFSGQPYVGGRWLAVYGGLDEIPVFAKAGAIVPLAPQTGWGSTASPERLTLHIFPGASNRFELYEDDGETTAYLQGAYALTPFELEWEAQQLTFHIRPVEGEAGLVPGLRVFDLVFHAINQPKTIQVQKNGEAQTPHSQYDHEMETLSLPGLELTPEDHLSIKLASSHTLGVEGDFRLVACRKMLRAFRMNTMAKLVLYERLPEVIEDPRQLSAILASLEESQLRALLEVILEAGVEELGKIQPGVFILWNQHHDERLTYRFSVDQDYIWNTKTHYGAENGPLPRSRVLSMHGYARPYRWMLRVDYEGLLTRRFQGQEQDLPADRK